MAPEQLPQVSARYALCASDGSLDVAPAFDGWGNIDEFVDGITRDAASVLHVSLRPSEVRALALSTAEVMQRQLEARGDGKSLLALDRFLGR